LVEFSEVAKRKASPAWFNTRQEKPGPKKARRFDDKVEPWRLKTRLQKGDLTTNLNLGGRKPGPKKARRFDDKVEPWRLKTRPQKGDSTTKLNRGGRKPGPKKANKILRKGPNP
jgi:hypothetical protein